MKKITQDWELSFEEYKQKNMQLMLQSEKEMNQVALSSNAQRVNVNSIDEVLRHEYEKCQKFKSILAG